MGPKPTVDSLSVLLLLPVEHGVLVLGQHLGLGGHLGLPTLQRLQRLTLLRQRGVDRRNDAIHGPEAQSVSAFLELGQAPGDLP